MIGCDVVSGYFLFLHMMLMVTIYGYVDVWLRQLLFTRTYANIDGGHVVEFECLLLCRRVHWLLLLLLISLILDIGYGVW